MPRIFHNFWAMSFKNNWLTSYQNIYSNISFPKTVNKPCPCGVTVITSHHMVITSSRLLQGYYIHRDIYLEMACIQICGISVGLFMHMNLPFDSLQNLAPITETSFCVKNILWCLQFDFGSLSPIVKTTTFLSTDFANVQKTLIKKTHWNSTTTSASA